MVYVMKKNRTLAAFFLLIPSWAEAATLQNFGPIQFDEAGISQALLVFGLLTVLSLAPSILIMASSFTRIIIVLSMLRNALGLQQTPPNMVLMSLALFLTLFTMAPILKTIYKDAYQPYQTHQLPFQEALKKAEIPLKTFMLKQTREKDLALMFQLAKEPLPNKAEAVSLHHLVPAFLLSELQTAFQIGFMIFLPFLLVDLIVSGILMTMGMMMVPPMSIALPIKILLFVLIDGWNLIIEALVSSFH
jgi:flagellar biosynthetic protein FliP